MNREPVAVLHVFVTLQVGGAENLLHSIVHGLDKGQYRSVVCCIGRKGELGERIAGEGFPVIELNRLQRGGWDRHIVSALTEVMKAHHIDLVHTHLFHANLYGRLAARRAGLPCVASVHNTYQKPKLHRRLINRFLARFTAAITVGSEEVFRDVKRYDGVRAERIHLLPNAINFDRAQSMLSRSDARRDLGIPEASLLLGTIGRLETQKGQSYLIEAVARLRQQNHDVRLLLIGSGREEQALRSLTSRMDLEPYVYLLGTRDDLGDLLAALDLYLQPSLWEGLSLAMLTAMAAGVPVIATSVGGVQDVLGNGQRGYVVPPGDTQALACQIAWCIEHHKEAAGVAAAGREYVLENFSDKTMVARLQNIYRLALAEQPGTRS